MARPGSANPRRDRSTPRLLLSGWFSNGVVVWNPQTEKVVEEYYDFNLPLNAVRFQGDLVVAELGSGSVVRASAAGPSQRTTLVKELGVAAGWRQTRRISG